MTTEEGIEFGYDGEYVSYDQLVSLVGESTATRLVKESKDRKTSSTHASSAVISKITDSD